MVGSVGAKGISGGSRSACKSGNGSFGPISDGSHNGFARSSLAVSVITSPMGHQLNGHPVPPKERRHRMKAVSSKTDMQRAADCPL